MRKKRESGTLSRKEDKPEALRLVLCVSVHPKKILQTVFKSSKWNHVLNMVGYYKIFRLPKFFTSSVAWLHHDSSSSNPAFTFLPMLTVQYSRSRRRLHGSDNSSSLIRWLHGKLIYPSERIETITCWRVEHWCTGKFGWRSSERETEEPERELLSREIKQ